MDDKLLADGVADRHANPPVKPNETPAVLERIEQLEISTADDQIFDRFSALAARTLRVPLALVSLVKSDRQVFKGMEGKLPEPWQTQRSTPLSHSFCRHVQTTGEALVVEDAREHPVVCDNLAIADLGVIAYLGVPLTTASGHTLGSLCAIDHQPRRWTAEEVEILRGLASLTMIEIELRLGRRQLRQSFASLKVNEERRNEHTRLLVHDLRTPLNSLLLGLRTIPLLGELNADQAESLELALRGGKTLVQLVDDLLDAEAAEEEGAASLRISGNLDAAQLVVQALAQVGALAENRGVTLRTGEITRLDQNQSVALDADADKVVRALVNLLSNAVKFTPTGGKVEITVVSDGSPEQEPVTFVVTDTGMGISPKDQARIFERYVHLDALQTGAQRSSGLGLSFVRAVAEAHGGKVMVESAVGRGSVFRLSLPRRQVRHALH